MEDTVADLTEDMVADHGEDTVVDGEEDTGEDHGEAVTEEDHTVDGTESKYALLDTGDNFFPKFVQTTQQLTTPLPAFSCHSIYSFSE